MDKTKKWLAFGIIFYITLLIQCAIGNINDVKGELARLLFEKDMRNTGRKEASVFLNSSYILDVSPEIREGRFEQDFFEFPAGFREVDQFNHNNEFSGFHETLRPIDDSGTPIIIQVIEWENVMFVAECSVSLCNIFKGDEPLKLQREQQITMTRPPTQVKFFSRNASLFLIIVANTSIIYRWESTYFDQVNSIDTPGAKAVEILSSNSSRPDLGNTLLTFAQPTCQVVSFNSDNGDVETLQYFDCSDAVAIIKYDVVTLQGPQQFILTLGANAQLQLFWWNYRAFSNWGNVTQDFGSSAPDIAFKALIQSEPFIFVSSKNKVSIFHAESTGLNLVRTVEIDGQVISANVDDSRLILLLAKEPHSQRQIVALNLHTSFRHVKGPPDNYSPVDCLRLVLDKIKSRGQKLDTLIQKRKRIVESNKSMKVAKVTVAGSTLFHNADINKVIVDPGKESLLQETPTGISNKLKEHKDKLSKIKQKLTELKMQALQMGERKKVLLKGMVRVNTLIAEALNISQLNGEKLDIEDFLSHRGNQNIKSLQAPSVLAQKLTTASLNDHSPDDLMQRKVKQQYHTGILKSNNIYAKNVQLGDISKINGISGSQLVRRRDSEVIVKGSKQFTGLAVEYLNATRINQLSTDEFVNTILPTEFSKNGENRLKLANLHVKNLNVENINSMEWNVWLETLREDNRANKQDYKYLNTSYINGVAVKDFLTKENKNNQEITNRSEITINSLTADNLRVNGKVNVHSKFECNSHQKLKSNQKLNLTTPDNYPNLRMNHKKYNSTVRGRFDDVNDTSNLLGKQKIHKLVIKGNTKVREYLNVHYLNGENLMERAQSIIHNDSHDGFENASFVNLELGNITLSKVNGVDFEVKNKSLHVPHLYLRSSARNNSHIGKIFVRRNVDGEINEMDLLELSKRSLSRTQDQLITGSFIMTNLSAQDIQVHNINGIEMNSLLFSTMSEEQVIDGDVNLKELSVARNCNVNKPLAQCDFAKIKSMNLSEVLELESVEIVGNLSWDENSFGESQSVSQLLKRAVRRSGLQDQVISAPVIFGKSVEMGILQTSHHINDIDLSFIVKDAVLSSVQHQVMNCNAFMKSVTADSASIVHDLSVDNINDVDIIALDKRLVRRSRPKSLSQPITGLKHFANGFNCYKLNAESIHGVKVSDLVFKEDATNQVRLLPPTQFNALEVYYNLTVGSINNLELNGFLSQLVSLSEAENITEAFQFKNSIKVDKLFASNINGIAMEESVMCDDHNVTIDGPITFHNSVYQIDPLANIYAKSVFGINIMETYEDSLKSNENSTIHGNLMIDANLTITGNLETDKINNCPVSSIYETEKSLLPKYVESSNSVIARKEYLRLSSHLKGKSHGVIFKYLEDFKSLDLQLDVIQSTSTYSLTNKSRTIEIYAMVARQCGLLHPSCLCSCHYTLSVNDDSTGLNVSVTTRNESVRTYNHFHHSLGEVQVWTNSISYKKKCQSNVDEVTEISCSGTGCDSARSLVALRGYLSDVKFFTLDDSVYIILAFHYSSHANDSHSGKVLVFELRESAGVATLKEIQDIPAHGVSILDAIWARPSYFLVIPNIRPAPDDKGAQQGLVITEFYIFDEKSNKFVVLKRIWTYFVVDVKAVRLGQDCFIYIVQDNQSPILAYKYDKDLQNFIFAEKIDNRYGFYSVNSLPFTDDTLRQEHMGVVLVNDQFLICKHKHIEGLVEVSIVKQRGVQALESFSVGDKQYLLALSVNSTSHIYRVHLQHL